MCLFWPLDASWSQLFCFRNMRWHQIHGSPNRYSIGCFFMSHFGHCTRPVHPFVMWQFSKVILVIWKDLHFFEVGNHLFYFFPSLPFFIVVLLQLSQYSPLLSPAPPTPCSHNQSPPCCPWPWVIYTCSFACLTESSLWKYLWLALSMTSLWKNYFLFYII